MKQMIKRVAKALLPPPQRARLRLLLRQCRYWGPRFQCPFCRSHLRAFQPFGQKSSVIWEQQIVGAGYRPQAECPICFSRDRERLLYLFLRTRTSLFHEPARVLHVAPEPQLSALLQPLPHLDYLTADIDGHGVMVQMDITAIDLPSNSFDRILCCHVLEHIPDDRRAMRELWRVLRPGGWAILQVPISPVLEKTFEDPAVVDPDHRRRVFGQSDHVRIYGRDYVARLAAAGFFVRPWDWKEDPHLSRLNHHNRFGLLPEEILFLAFKDAAGAQAFSGQAGTPDREARSPAPQP